MVPNVAERLDHLRGEQQSNVSKLFMGLLKEFPDVTIIIHGVSAACAHREHTWKILRIKTLNEGNKKGETLGESGQDNDKYNPELAISPVKKSTLNILTQKSESAQGFFEQWLPLSRPESSNLSLRTEDSIRQNLGEKVNTVWARKES